VWGYDGQVDDNDILKLSGTYYATSPTGNAAECDVGPTVHEIGHRLGLPTPDALIDFEDMMIFAMNYGAVSPRVVPLLPDVAYEGLSLALVEKGEAVGGELELALRLDGNSAEVKGLSALLSYDPNELEFLSVRLSDSMASPLGRVFFWHGTEMGAIRIDAAVMGTGVTIGGSGDVAVVTFRVLGADPMVELAEAVLRGANNEDLEADLVHYAATGGDIPATFRLVQNVPNPFSPSTAIAYHVSETSHVSVRIYSAGGRLVRTLVDADVEPGRYSALWDGASDAGGQVGSGVYFCTMEAGGFEASRKMLMLK
jgi:hypothetical protein